MTVRQAGDPSRRDEQRWADECARWAESDRRVVVRVLWTVAVAISLCMLAWLAIALLRPGG